MRENERYPSSNPFRVPPQLVENSRKRAFYSSLKVCLVAVCALSLTVVLASQSRRWLLYRMTSDFDSLPSESQSLRLVEISGLDELGIAFLVDQLVNEDRMVARQAYDLLSENQSRWSMLSPPHALTRHQLLVDSLQRIVDRVDMVRIGWVTSLLQQTIVENVQQDDEESHALHLAATDLLARLTISDRTDERIAAFESEVLDAQLVRPSPLTMTENNDPGEWIKWPPQSEPNAGDAERIAPDNSSASDSPSIYRSSAGDAAAAMLIPTDPQSVQLQEFEPATSQVASFVDTTVSDMPAPLQTYNVRSVIYWLSSSDPEQRRQAELELMRRGLDSKQIAIAQSLSLGSVEARLETIERITHDAAIDPRPWLIWLLDDEYREVKLRALNILATIPDPSIQAVLRDRITTESDPAVAAKIRRALELR